MARVKDIINQWGKQGGPNPQRSDLWQVDLTAVIHGINRNPDAAALPLLPLIARYYHASITLPELKIKAEPVRRDSRSYNMPSWDEPLEAIRMNFVMDDGGNGKGTGDTDSAAQSDIYMILDAWRSVVRAGRGAVGSEVGIQLNANYRIDYTFPVYIYLLKGQAMPVLSNAYSAQTVPASSSTFSTTFDSGATPTKTSTQVTQAGNFSQLFAQQTGLDVSGVLHLENAWLAGFKIADMTYERSGTLMIEATLFVDNILQIRRPS